MSINLHIYPVEIPLLHQSRIIKTIDSLLDSGTVGLVHFVGIDNPKCRRVEHYHSKLLVWGFKQKYGWLKIPKLRSLFWKIEYHLSIFFTYLNRDVSVIHCNSSEDLLSGVLLKIFKKNVKLIYDAHELETEKRNMKGIDKAISKFSERILIKYVDQVIVVSYSIKSWYEEHYQGAKVEIIKGVPHNTPYLDLESHNPIFREKFNIKEGLVFIYQGAFFTGRGIDIILKVFQKPEQKNHVIVMGFGPMEQEIIQAAEKYPNIHYQEAVTPEEIPRYTGSADVGICLFENTCVSHYFVLPNKFFEYCLSGLAIIASDFPDLTTEIKKVQNGWNIEVSEERLEETINSLTHEEVEDKKANARKYRPNIGWHVEEKKLINIYTTLS